MSSQALWDRVRMAWAMLADRRVRDVQPGRPQAEKPVPRGDEPQLAADGFAEEALPWIDAVYSTFFASGRFDR